MTIKIGDSLPAGTLTESVGYDDGKNCPMPPQPVDIAALCAGKKVVIFGLPGAFTPTCSGSHVPGYLKNFDALKAKGVDAIVCMAVNDGFVMGAWGRSQNVGDKIRMLGVGSDFLVSDIGKMTPKPVRVKELGPGETGYKIPYGGLYRFVSCPNYFGELGFWCSMALFGVAAAPADWWWLFIGVAAMLAMFLGASIPLMEKRSLERRPNYQAVIDRVPRLVPRPPRRAAV